MRELAVRVRFTAHSLGNVKRDHGRFFFYRDPAGCVTFMPTWHRANMAFAAQVLGRHQDEVGKISWDGAVDAAVRRDSWYKRYYPCGGRPRYTLHESFVPGQVCGFNCVVPAAVTDDDLWQLLSVAGKYRGLSPARPGEFGFFEVVEIRPRRPAPAEDKKTGPREPLTLTGPKMG